MEEGSLYPALQRMLKGDCSQPKLEPGKGPANADLSAHNAGIQHLEREVISFEKMFAGITRVLAAAKA